MNTNEISIAELIDKFEEDIIKYPDVLDAIYLNAKPLAEKIHKILKSAEDLRIVDKNFPQSTTPLVADPITGQYSKELVVWAVSILTTAWTQWIFTSKSMEDSDYQIDPKYINDLERLAARVNVKIARAYIRNLILDAIEAASKIGASMELKYRPDPKKEPMNMELRKD